MRKRKNQINIYLSDEECAKLQAILDKAKISKSAFVRLCIKGKAIKAAPTPEYKGLYTEINRIGRNINQIAKKCNEGEEVLSVREPLLFYMAELYKLLDKHL